MGEHIPGMTVVTTSAPNRVLMSYIIWMCDLSLYIASDLQIPNIMTCHLPMISSSGWSQAIVRQSSKALIAVSYCQRPPTFPQYLLFSALHLPYHELHPLSKVCAGPSMILFPGFTQAGPASSPTYLFLVAGVRTILQDTKYTWQEESSYIAKHTHFKSILHVLTEGERSQAT